MDQKTALNQTAAEFLAHAALDLFPNTQLLGGRGTSRYFYYDFQFPFPFHKQTLSLIEERLVRLLKTRTQIKKREMVPSNAAQLFASRSQEFLAEKLKTIVGLASICEINDFLDYCPYLFSLNWPFTPYLKLFETETLSYDGRSAIRIIGALSPDKDELKAQLRAPSPTASNHRHFAVEEKLFLPLDDGHWMWQPKGEILRELLLQRWKEIVFKEKFNIVSTFCPDHNDPNDALLQLHQNLFSHSGINKLAEIAYFPFEKDSEYREGLFETKGGFTDRLTLFSTEENFLQTCISSLHFILEMPRILGFEFQLTLGLSTAKGVRRRQGGSAKNTNSGRILQDALDKSGLDYVVENDYRSGSEAWVEIKLADALGRLWSGPFISVPMQTQVPTLVCSVFGTMERLVGLLLERYAGSLPLWIAPEQVRLIPLSKDAHRYADRVQGTLKSEGIRSTIDVQNSEPGRELGSRLYQAIVEKIPYAVIMGDREIQAENLVVRTLGSQQEERMNVDALCKCIRGKFPS